MLCNVHVVQVVVVHVANVVLTQALDVARAKAWHQRRRLIPSRLPLEATLRNCSAQRIDQSKLFSHLRHIRDKVWESAQVAINQTSSTEIFLFNPVTFNLKTRVWPSNNYIHPCAPLYLHQVVSKALSTGESFSTPRHCQEAIRAILFGFCSEE